jgi:hypothetical protein
MASGIRGFAEDLEKQAVACRRSSQLYGALMSELAHLLGAHSGGELKEVLETAWAERAFAVWYERPLLLALALHDMALENPGTHPLSRAYPSCGGDPARFSGELVLEAVSLLSNSELHRELLKSGYVQTNDVSRGVVWVWTMAALQNLLPAEIALFDLGASAGLNLLADQLAHHWPGLWRDGHGQTLKLEPIPKITARIGYDRSPTEIRDPVAVRRLRASVWADDLARMKRLDEALALALQFRNEERLWIGTADLLQMPALVFDECRKRGTAAVIYHTYAADYLPSERRADFERFMRDLLVKLPDGSLWIEFESARSGSGGSRLSAGTANGELRVRWNRGGMLAAETLARAAPHPVSLDIDLGALGRLRGA